MRRLVLAAALLAAPSASLGECFSPARGEPAGAQTVALTRSALPGEILLPRGRLYPNGITRASDGTLYVGLVTSGEVLRRAPDGSWSTFFPGSDQIYAGTSLRLDEARGLLWGTSPDFLPGARARPHRIFALDSRTGAVRRVLSMPDDGFGNDLALGPDGGVFVTDSRNGRVLRLRPGADRLETIVEHPDLRPVGGVGVGGVARAPDGRLIVGNFGSGRLFVIDRVETGRPIVRPLALPRPLENPDGLAFGADGALLILESAVQSGDGKLLRVPEPFGPGSLKLEVLRDGLPSPVNLTVANDLAYVTLSRIRHRLLPRRETETPEVFGVLPVDLSGCPRAERVVALIDADHGPDTYADGLLPPDEGGRDAVLVLDGDRRPRALPASNSVTSPPEAMAVTRDGRYAFVVERLRPRSPGQTRASELAQGRRLTALDLDADEGRGVLATLDLPFRPESVRVAPDGGRMAVAGNDATGPVLAVLPFEGERFGPPLLHRPTIEGRATATFADWSPDGSALSLHLNDRDEIRFLRWTENGMVPWGEPVRSGPDPFTGRWSPDGRYYFALEWGRNLKAANLAERLPTVASSVGVIWIDPSGSHLRISGASTDRSSEGIAVSFDGRWIATVNMRETALPPGSPRHTPTATLSLFAFNPTSGLLTKVDERSFAGVLPEGAAFSSDGRRVYVTVYADRERGGGRVDVWRVDAKPRPSLAFERSITTPVGVHHVEAAGLGRRE